MGSRPNLQKSLIDVNDSVLVVIDIQDYFLNKYDNSKSQALLAKAAWLIHMARRLDVPIVAMAEDIEHTEPLTKVVQDALPEEIVVHNKDFFGLAGNPVILADIESKNRGTAICIGLETDVCVAQSAIGLVEAGYKVAVARDAIATSDPDEEIGIGRMRDAGVAISSVKGVFYEWIRGVSNFDAFERKFNDFGSMTPPNLIL